MAKQEYPTEFETYWKAHEAALIEAAPRALREERANSNRMNTAGDWLIYVIPFMVMGRFDNAGLIANEMLNFIISIVLGVLCFGLVTFIKPYVTNKRNIVDIDQDIKDYFFSVYRKEGLCGLEKLA